ncbi:MAG: MFS transporter [Peptococcaceae bacterium]
MYWKRNLWFLSAAVFIANVAFTLTFPFVPSYIQQLGVTDNVSVWSGIMVSVNFLTYAVMAPIWGSFADRHGKRNMFIRSGAGIALSYILMGIAQNHWQFLFLRGFNGLLAGFIPAAVMLVATNTPEFEIGYALGMLNTFIALGSIMGPFIGGSLVHYLNIRMTFFVSAGLLGLATLLAVFGTKENILQQQTRTIIWRELKNILGNRSLTVYFLALVVLQTTLYMIQPILPIRIGQLVETDVDFITGIVFSIMGISLAMGSPLISKIKGANYLSILFWGLMMCAVFSIGQGATYSVMILILARFLFGFANAAVNVSSNVLIAQNTSEEIRGRVFGALNGLTALGSVIGPLIGGFLGENWGTASPFYGCAVLFIIAGGAVWYFRMGTRKTG